VYSGFSTLREKLSFMNINKYKLATVLLLVINSQVLFVNVANPLSIRWTQEFFLGILTIYAVYYFLTKSIKNGRLNSSDLFIWVVVIVIILGSSVLALIQYGQPLIYGLIESRQALALLVYFPLKRLVYTKYIDGNFILKCVVMISLAILFIALLMKAGVISQEAIDTGNDLLRADRNSMGRYYFILSFIIALVKFYSTRKKIQWAVLSLLFFYAIFFILQERQSMVAIVLIGCIYIIYNGMKIGRIKSTFLIFFLILVVSLSVMYGFESQKDKIATLLGSVTPVKLAVSVRANTMLTMWNELKDSNGLGFGALSLMWKDGFHRFYGSNFYLGDVGIFGTLFRLGIFALPLLAYVTFKLIIVLRHMQPSYVKDVVALGYLYGLFTLPTSGLLEYKGFFLGLLFCLAVTSHYTTRALPNNPRKIRMIGIN